VIGEDLGTSTQSPEMKEYFTISHWQAVDGIQNAFMKDGKRCVLLTGSSGSGKRLVVKEALADIGSDITRIFIPELCLTVRSFIHTIYNTFIGDAEDVSDIVKIKAIRESLIKQYTENKSSLLVMRIDKSVDSDLLSIIPSLVGISIPGSSEVCGFKILMSCNKNVIPLLMDQRFVYTAAIIDSLFEILPLSPYEIHSFMDSALGNGFVQDRMDNSVIERIYELTMGDQYMLMKMRAYIYQLIKYDNKQYFSERIISDIYSSRMFKNFELGDSIDNVLVRRDAEEHGSVLKNPDDDNDIINHEYEGSGAGNDTLDISSAAQDISIADQESKGAGFESRILSISPDKSFMLEKNSSSVWSIICMQVSDSFSKIIRYLREKFTSAIESLRNQKIKELFCKILIKEESGQKASKSLASLADGEMHLIGYSADDLRINDTLESQIGWRQRPVRLMVRRMTYANGRVVIIITLSIILGVILSGEYIVRYMVDHKIVEHRSILYIDDVFQRKDANFLDKLEVVKKDLYQFLLKKKWLPEKILIGEMEVLHKKNTINKINNLQNRALESHSEKPYSADVYKIYTDILKIDHANDFAANGLIRMLEFYNDEFYKAKQRKHFIKAAKIYEIIMKIETLQHIPQEMIDDAFSGNSNE